MNRSRRKLKLATERVRVLAREDLQAVVGGAIPTSGVYTCTCRSDGPDCSKPRP